MQQDFKYSYLSSYMLKPNSLPTKVFNDNNKAQENIFKLVCNFGALEEWINWIIAVSYYIDVETRNDQYRLLDPTPLDCIAGYIM